MFKVGDKVRIKTKKELARDGINYEDWILEYQKLTGLNATIYKIECKSQYFLNVELKPNLYKKYPYYFNEDEIVSKSIQILDIE